MDSDSSRLSFCPLILAEKPLIDAEEIGLMHAIHLMNAWKLTYKNHNAIKGETNKMQYTVIYSINCISTRFGRFYALREERVLLDQSSKTLSTVHTAYHPFSKTTTNNSQC
jgi:hypothetical protein